MSAVVNQAPASVIIEYESDYDAQLQRNKEAMQECRDSYKAIVNRLQSDLLAMTNKLVSNLDNVFLDTQLNQADTAIVTIEKKLADFKKLKAMVSQMNSYINDFYRVSSSMFCEDENNAVVQNDANDEVDTQIDDQSVVVEVEEH